MDEQDEKIMSATADYMWDEMSLMRQYGFTDVEGDLRVEDGVLRADVRGKAPTAAEFITLTFNTETLNGNSD
jgi:hypothetical protein